MNIFVYIGAGGRVEMADIDKYIFVYIDAEGRV